MKKISSIYISLITILMFTFVATPLSHAAEKDLTPPSDVTGVKAVAGDKSVSLSWDASTDNVGVTAYRIHYGLDPVTAEGGGSYMFTKDTPNVMTFTVDGLENNVKYYFSFTALDGSGNESQYYSTEVSATPSGTVAVTSPAPSAPAPTDTKPSVTEPAPTTAPVAPTAPANNSTKPVDSIQNSSNGDNLNATTNAQPVVETKQVADLIAPMFADFASKIENGNSVKLSWLVKNEKEASLVDQMLYQSTNNGKSYSEGQSLGSSVREYLVSSLKGGQTYTFKLTGKDAKGKETEGVTTSVTLPQTGAGLIGLAVASLGLGGLVSRKKK